VTHESVFRLCATWAVNVMTYSFTAHVFVIAVVDPTLNAAASSRKPTGGVYNRSPSDARVWWDVDWIAANERKAFSSVASPNFRVGPIIVGFKRATVFRVGHRHSKHKTTRCARHSAGHGPFAPLVYAYENFRIWSDSFAMKRSTLPGAFRSGHSL